MDDVSVDIHSFDDHHHLEVIADPGGRNVTALLTEFVIVDTDRPAITRREKVPQSYSEEIRTLLEDAGYMSSKDPCLTALIGD